MHAKCITPEIRNKSDLSWLDTPNAFENIKDWTNDESQHYNQEEGGHSPQSEHLNRCQWNGKHDPGEIMMRKRKGEERVKAGVNSTKLHRVLLEVQSSKNPLNINIMVRRRTRKRRGHSSLSDHLKSPVSIIRPSIGDSSTLFTKMVTLDPVQYSSSSLSSFF